MVALASSDNDLGKITFPIPANDTAVESISVIVDEIASAYASGRSTKA